MRERFRHPHRVTYAECTVGNHVYYARYLDFLEEARAAWLRELGNSFLEWQARDVIFPVLEAHLRYHSPARYDDVLETEIWLTKAERVRLHFAYRVTHQSGVLVLEGATHHVCTGLNEKPKRLPAELLAALQPHVFPEGPVPEAPAPTDARDRSATADSSARHP